MKTATLPTGHTSDFHLLSRLFFRLLPYQVLLIVINAVNGIVDGLFASNAIGSEAMSAIGLNVLIVWCSRSLTALPVFL